MQIMIAVSVWYGFDRIVDFRLPANVAR